MNREQAKAKANEALGLATEVDDPKQAQAIATISTHWLALAATLPKEDAGMSPEAYL